jgi:hypothetical protein
VAWSAIAAGQAMMVAGRNYLSDDLHLPKQFFQLHVGSDALENGKENWHHLH